MIRKKLKGKGKESSGSKWAWGIKGQSQHNPDWLGPIRFQTASLHPHLRATQVNVCTDEILI